MRLLRRAILGLSLLALAWVGVCLFLWGVGVVVSDRYLWAQRLSFVPRQFLVWPAGIGWLLFAGSSLAYRELRPRGEGMPWRSERRGRSRVPRLLGRLRGVVGVLVLVATLHLVGVEWRWPMNAGGRAAPPVGERLRIVYWNVGWSHPDEVFASIAARRPDLAIVANPLTRTDLSWSFPTLASELGGEGRVIRDWPINVVSRYPIRRWGVTELGFTSPVSVAPAQRSTTEEPPRDPGHAMFVELEVGGPLSRSVVVWIIDLPSDPELSRASVTRRAKERIGMWLGPGGEGFPEPDVMIGDFNIPSGSWSLGTLRRRPGYVMEDAHRQGGLGAAATWPASGPMFRIDQCFVGPGLRAARYAVEDGGDTRHLMQVVDLVEDGAGAR